MDLILTSNQLCPLAQQYHFQKIVVGNTNREISNKLNANTEGLEFAILADEGNIALESTQYLSALCGIIAVSLISANQKEENNSHRSKGGTDLADYPGKRKMHENNAECGDCLHDVNHVISCC